MTYKKKLKITQEELNYYNELLRLDLDKCLPYYNEHDIERLGAKTYDYIEIRKIDFDNGNYITLYLASGNSSYYDNIVLWNKNNQKLMWSDCNYEIGNFSLCYEDDIYDIEMVVE